MDGSCNEKAKVLEFKAAVKRNLKYRRRSKTAGQQDAGLSEAMMVSQQYLSFASDHRLTL